MILAKIDSDRFVGLIRTAPLIAFQDVQFGYAIAAPGEAYYAPMDHPGGGNLPIDFGDELGHAFIKRMSRPTLRTLRPTAKPIPQRELLQYLESLGGNFLASFEEAFKKVAGDHPAVVDFQTQVVIRAIEEHDRPELKMTMDTLKRDMMSDALDLIIEHAEAARELCEVGDAKPMQIRLHLMQATQAMKTALEMMLKP